MTVEGKPASIWLPRKINPSVEENFDQSRQHDVSRRQQVSLYDVNIRWGKWHRGSNKCTTNTERHFIIDFRERSDREMYLYVNVICYN